MSLLSMEEVQSEINKINAYLSKCLWMDFECCQMSFIKIMLSGSVDESYGGPAIEIEFEQPYFISSLFLWQTDTSKPFIQLVSAEEERELITKYRVEQGNYIFKINAEDYENPPILIAAKKISCKILKDNPFPQN